MEQEKTYEASASIYVIDKNYRLVYYNERLAKRIPGIKTGDFCYERLCLADSPCKDCPILGKHGSDSMFYNRLLGKWVEAIHGELEWPGAGRCTILFAKMLDEGNKNLFYNLTRVSMYEELFELNLSKNTYKILMHQEGKYVIPDLEGVLDDMVADVANHLIHPDDRERFLEFWDLERVKTCFENTDDAFMKGEFRKRLQSGGYGWSAQIAVPLPYSNDDDDIIICFIQDIQEQKEREGCQISQLDELTGLYLKNVFFKEAEAFLADKNPGGYCIMSIDIEHFKLYNDWYGRETGDHFLRQVGGYLKTLQEDGSCVAGYAGDDDFMLLMPMEWQFLTKVQKQLVLFAKEKGNNAGFLPAFGIYQVKEDGEQISSMYDRAMIAMDSVKGNYVTRVAVYDSSMKKKMEDDQVLLLEIQRALQQREFVFYAQPKCNMLNGKIVGLESLVRWQHPERGLVPPSEFIPVLEENGFITNLDLYIWDSVCKHVSQWIAMGHAAIPISVNVSRVDIYALDVVRVFKDLISKYGLEPRLIEIEITESAYVENYDVISGTVNELRMAGFTVLMDDFGSGYSSLNMLRDVNVDVLKIDMKFLDMNENSFSRGVGILEAIVKMAHLMRLRLIAEGVETKEQAEFLTNIGCMYAQGYYYYRPMPVQELEALLLQEENIDFKGIRARQIEQIRVTDLFTENLASESMIDNILGGVALYDFHNGQLELLNANEQYLRITGDNPIDLEEMKRSIIEFVCQEDRDVVLEGFRKAMENPVTGAEIVFRRYRKSGEQMWMSMRAFFLREQDGHRLFYGGVSDVTEKKLQEQQLSSTQKMLEKAFTLVENNASFMQLAEDNRKIASNIFAQMTPGGIIGGYCEEDFPLYFANDEMVKLLGYQSYDELAEGIEWKVARTIHPDDMAQVRKDIGPTYYKGLEYTTTYRMPRKDGSWFWTLDKGHVVEAEDGRLAIISACTDITESKEIQLKLEEANRQLYRQNLDLNYLYNNIPGGYYRCMKNRDLDFTYISNRFLEILGYGREEIRDLFDDKFSNMIHPDDREEVLRSILRSDGQGIYSLEYRMLSKQGYITVVEQAKEAVRDGHLILCGIIMDRSVS